MSAAADLATGIKTKWAATAAITALIPTARLYADKADGSPAFPYAVATVTRDRPNDYVIPRRSGSGYHAFYRVTVKVRAKAKAGSGSADEAATAVLAGLAGEFAVPNSQHFCWESAGDVEVAEEKGSAQGETVYVATLEFASELVRTLP